MVSSSAATSSGDGIDAIDPLTRPAAALKDGSTRRRATASRTASALPSVGISEMPEPADSTAAAFKN